MVQGRDVAYLGVLVTVVLFAQVSSFTRTVTQDAMDRCHQGKRDNRVRCGEYANLESRAVREAKRLFKRQTEGEGGPPDDCSVLPENEVTRCEGCTDGSITDDCVFGGDAPEEPEEVDYPELEESWCLDIDWDNHTFTMNNNWGSCMVMTTDETHRYITSNNVPDFFVNTYCPLGLGLGYCTDAEIAADTCFFTDLICGEDNGEGSNDYGDVWVAQEDNYKILLVGDPTRDDRPSDMYDSSLVDGAKTNGAATAVATNGIGIQGPNDAGDVSIDEAGLQLACGGHVTPPMGNANTTNGPSGPPKYHFHKSPECQPAFTNASIGYAAGAVVYEHAQLMAWAVDGFGVYAYQDVDGSAPIVDECGGHFGPVDTGEVVYHYHSRPIVPYHLACQGPALGKCADTQSGVNYCHPGCGSDICVQPGTSEAELKAYIAGFSDTWLEDKIAAGVTINDYTSGAGSGAGNMFLVVLGASVVKYLVL